MLVYNYGNYIACIASIFWLISKFSTQSVAYYVQFQSCFFLQLFCHFNFNVHALKCTTMYYSCLYTQSFIKNTLENELDVKFDEYNVVNYTPKEYQDPQLGDGNLYTTLVCGHLHTVLLR